MKKFLVRSLLAVFSIVLLVAIGTYVVVSNSLPLLDGELVVDGLAEDVVITRDANGIPTIVAANRNDLAYATGFAHGQDRFFQMDLTRRNAAGELAEIVGAAALGIDRRHRFHRFRARAERVLAGLDSVHKGVLDAYVKGVNDGLGSLNARPFEYFLLGVEPRQWRMSDSLLVAYSMFLQLNDETADRDIDRGLAFRTLPQPLFEWLFPSGTEWDAPMDESLVVAEAIPTADEFSLAGVLVAAGGSGTKWANDKSPGSNNWAVSGQLTSTGRAIVANDMHLGLAVPNVFYRARLKIDNTAKLDLNGVTLPGVPIMVAGSNGHVAWANTNSNGDWTDAVIVTAGDTPDTYLSPDGQKPIATIVETIVVKGAAPETLEIRETEWGPILEETPDPGQTIAVSWIAHHVESLTLGHLDLENVRNVTEALDIAGTMGTPPQNLVVGDADGNIGWTIAGKIPMRPPGESRRPVDWSRSGGWSGWVRPEDYPRIVNPESGRIWTANARVVGGEALNTIGDGGYVLGARAQQIRDDLFALEELSIDDMLSIQLDDRAVFLGRWRDLLLEILTPNVVTDNAERATFRHLLIDWTPRALDEAVGYRLVNEFRLEAAQRVIDMLMHPIREQFGPDTYLPVSKQFEAPLWEMVNQKPTHLISDNYSDWNDLLLQSVDTVIHEYAREYDDGLENRTWGERNTARIRHPLSNAVPFLAGWLDMPAEKLSGATDMPRVQWPAFGASERFAVSPGDEENGYLHMPAGQSGHPLSDFYAAGHDDWVEGRKSSFLPGTPVYTLTLRATR
ncbi:MAG: penicillin acylase family protein [Woeseiaceae bacterium]